jgi:hypothetical protein
MMDIRMRNSFVIPVLVLATLTVGCSINHPVAKDYGQHLVKYGAETTLPNTEFEADYLIGTKTENHNYQFRSATVGYAHVWIVEFGKILDETINSNYVQTAFGRLEKGSGGKGKLVEFELESFEFKNYRAYTALNIKIISSGSEVFSKTYRSEGGSQGGQMWGAGPFGMKNATLKSTKQSIDIIFEQFIHDVNANELMN